MGKEHIRFEHCLRSFRFRRLAGEQAVAAPLIEALDLTAGVIPDIDYDVPALRLAWENQTFFDSNDDQLIEGVLPILDLVASAVHRDIGDVQLYVVGHTDSRGADDYNQDLSRRHGRAVVERLSAAGYLNDRQVAEMNSHTHNMLAQADRRYFDVLPDPATGRELNRKATSRPHLPGPPKLRAEPTPTRTSCAMP